MPQLDPGAMPRLAAETEVHHTISDEPLHRLLAAPSRRDYENWLLTTYGFVEPLEAELEHTPGLREMIALRPRRKADLLLRDLTALHVAPDEPLLIARCAEIRPFRGVETALGWMYVIERATLLHGTVFRHLARHLPGEVAFGSSYLKCYDGRLGEMWRGFGEIVEIVGQGHGSTERIIRAAIDAFACQGAWRRRSP